MLGLGVWKFSKNIDVAKEFIQFLFRKENYDAWIVASNAFNHPPLRQPRRPSDLGPQSEVRDASEGSGVRPSAAAGPPSRAMRPRRIDEAFVLPDMTAKAVNGMPTKRAMEWAQDQVARAIKGQLKVGFSVAVSQRALEATGLRGGPGRLERLQAVVEQEHVFGYGLILARARAAHLSRRLPVRDGDLLQPLRLLGRLAGPVRRAQQLP